MQSVIVLPPTIGLFIIAPSFGSEITEVLYSVTICIGSRAQATAHAFVPPRTPASLVSDTPLAGGFNILDVLV